MTTKAELKALAESYESVLREIIQTAKDRRGHYERLRPKRGEVFEDGVATGWEDAARMAERVLPDSPVRIALRKARARQAAAQGKR